MFSILDQIHQNIEFFLDGGNQYKEYVCVLSIKDYIRLGDEIKKMSYLAQSTCVFDFAPSKEVTIEESFISINSNGITIHFKVGKFSYIGPVIALK